EQDGPSVADPFVEADGALRSLGGEIGRGLIDAGYVRGFSCCRGAHGYSPREFNLDVPILDATSAAKAALILRHLRRGLKPRPFKNWRPLRVALPIQTALPMAGRVFRSLLNLGPPA